MSFEDKPIAYRLDGSPIYDNAPSVVAVAITDYSDNLLVIRRATNPGKGLLAFPGGFQMRGEKWRDTGVREVKEEVGLDISESIMKHVSTDTDSYGHNVIIGRVNIWGEAFHTKIEVNEDEVEEIVAINKHNFAQYAGEWAFPLHLMAAYQLINCE